MMPWVRQAFHPAHLLIGREVIWSTRGVQQGDPLRPFLFAAGIQAALDALNQGGALHRWYLDNGVFLGSVVVVEEVLGALRQTLPKLGLELNLRKTKVWGPGLVPVLLRSTFCPQSFLTYCFVSCDGCGKIFSPS